MRPPARMTKLPPSVRLRSLAALIRRRKMVTVADSYSVGKWLIEAKTLVPRGTFGKWMTEAAGLTPDTAQRCMIAAKRITAPVELMRGVKISAAIALAKKKVARSATLTERAFTAEPGKDGLIGLRAMQSALSTADPSVIHNLEAAKEGPVEALGRRLMQIAADPAITSLFMTFDRDEEELPAVAIVVMGETRRSISRTTVMEAIAAIAGEEATIRCPSCKRHLAPSSFSKASHSCKTCERARVKAYSKKKRTERQATRQRIQEM